jgi:hypothetical protein
MIKLLRYAVHRDDKDDNAQDMLASHFDSGRAAMLEKHLRSYAIECFKSGGHRLASPGLHSSWLLRVSNLTLFSRSDSMSEQAQQT